MASHFEIRVGLESDIRDLTILQERAPTANREKRLKIAWARLRDWNAAERAEQWTSRRGLTVVGPSDD